MKYLKYLSGNNTDIPLAIALEFLKRQFRKILHEPRRRFLHEFPQKSFGDSFRNFLEEYLKKKYRKIRVKNLQKLSTDSCKNTSKIPLAFFFGKTSMLFLRSASRNVLYDFSEKSTQGFLLKKCIPLELSSKFKSDNP